MRHPLWLSRHLLALGLIAAVAAPTTAHGQTVDGGCGELRAPGQYGPYDYRTDKAKLPVVEIYHFEPATEALIRGGVGSPTDVGGSIDYTLRAFPNHHRALLAMVRLGEKTNSTQPSGVQFRIECYFKRSIAFKPDDFIVRMIYAIHLSKLARTTEAVAQLQNAATLAGDNPLSQYNIGLIYFDMKEYDNARQQAHKAAALGNPQTALRDQLKGVGKWADPEASPQKPDAKTP